MENQTKVGAFFVDNKGNSYWSSTGMPSNTPKSGGATKPAVCLNNWINIFKIIGLVGWETKECQERENSWSN